MATNSLRPYLSFTTPGETEPERHLRHFDEWTEKRDEFMDAVEKHRVFLPVTLYRRFHSIRQSAEKEAFNFRAALKYGEGKLTMPAYEQGEKNRQELSVAIDVALNDIRQRYGLDE